MQARDEGLRLRNFTEIIYGWFLSMAFFPCFPLFAIKMLLIKISNLPQNHVTIINNRNIHIHYTCTSPGLSVHHNSQVYWLLVLVYVHVSTSGRVNPHLTCPLHSCLVTTSNIGISFSYSISLTKLQAERLAG